MSLEPERWICGREAFVLQSCDVRQFAEIEDLIYDVEESRIAGIKDINERTLECVQSSI